VTTTDVEIRHLPERRRFEIYLAGERVGLATYHDESDRRVMLHTEIRPDLGGRGLAGQLVRAALDATRAEGLLVVPQCPYVKDFIEKHPEYADLVGA
jgi:predicted GNAT family acetyltransferase